MSDLQSQLHALLTDVVLPSLKAIHASQIEQRFQTDSLNQSLEEFRAEMQMRFAELRAELAACRQEVEDLTTALREIEVAAEPAAKSKKTLVH